MKFSIQSSMWGRFAGTPAGITAIKDLFYLSNHEDQQALREVNAAGYDGVEFFDGNVERYRSDPERLARLLRDTDLTLAAVYAGANFIYADAFEDEMARLEATADLSQRLGARFFVIGGGAIRATGTRQADYDALASGLDAVASMARRHGLTATYHPHMGTMSQSSDAFERVMGLTQIELCLDVGHVLAGGGDPVQIARKYRDRIRYIHLQDRADNWFRPVGEGKVDFRGVLAELSGDFEPEWAAVEFSFNNHRPTDIPLQLASLLRRRVGDLVGAAGKGPAEARG